MSLANFCQEMQLKTSADAFVKELKRYSYNNWVPRTWQMASVRPVRFLDGRPTMGEDDVYGVFFHKMVPSKGRVRPLPLPKNPVPEVILMLSHVGGEYPLLVKILPRSKTGVRFAEEFMTRCRKLWDTPDARRESSQPEAMEPGKYPARLLQILDERFSGSELRRLCFDLDVDYENLPGEGKADKARELIDYLRRRERLSDLVETGKRLRDEISWPEAASNE